ncbi:hybrid sensor histidine kinase/response regulator [Dokdonella sp.]|uniref:two-component regulator propeller domain-containing protein n=1 Tax=Dokdonella sp. TaxID=2291710 RepID=UPI0025BB2BA6|nr:hybrid sensor histidine kinase/response regulator [Dokdonella sp.]MBX3690899.1 response regulator [Dokdonella sp.]MCW5568943.1 response regulator [Dokdonella sp.]
MNRMLAALFGLAMAMPVLAVPPGPPRFHVLRTTDGLPSNMPQVIRQDREGYLWIGTRHGLARYDGIGFRHWLHDPRDPASLSGNGVVALLVDRHGQLWCGVEGAGVSLMQADGRFRHFRHVVGDERSLGSDDVLALAEDADGAIWVGTYLGGLARIGVDRRVQRFEHSAETPAGPRSNFVLGLAVDALGRLWVGTDRGLDVRTSDGRWTAVDLPPDAASMVGAFLAEDDGSMLVGLRGGVVRVRDDLGVEGRVGAPVNATVTALVRERDGRLWAATSQQGLLRAEGDGWQVFAAGDHAPDDVPGMRVFDAMRDREDNLWFAFADGGVARLSPSVRRFAVWRHRRNATASLTHSRLAGVAADPRGGAWIVSANHGLDHVAADGTVTRHGTRIPNDAALRSIAATDGQVWIGRWRGVLRYAPDGGQVEEIAVGAAEGVLPEAPVVLLRVAPDGAVWAVARGGGVSRIDPRTRAVRTWAPAFGTLGHADITALRFDRDGRPWTVGSRGFERFDVGADRFVSVGTVQGAPIEAFDFAADGSIWLHRLGALERYRAGARGLERVDAFDIDDGWPSMEVRDIHVASDGEIWVAGYQGLWRVEPVLRRLRMYGEHDGLPSAELVGGPLAASADGTLYAATLGGLVAFDPQAMSEGAPPPVRITSVSLRRDGALLELDMRAAPLVLRHDDRDLHVQARALSFAMPGSHRYAFRLQPDESDWIDAGRGGERTFSQLPAGTHELSVRVSNADGRGSELATPLIVRVTAPPWRHPLAWVAYALLVALAAILVWRMQHRRVEQRHRLALAEERRVNAERLDAAKSAFLADMSHEIRTPMTGVLGMAELLQRSHLDARQREYVDAIASSGELLLRLVNDSLDLARIGAGRLVLEPRPFDPRALVRDVAAHGRALATRKALELRTEVAADIPSCVRGDALRLRQVLLNLVHNALKFTEHGGVELRLSRTPDQLVFHVADSGPGLTERMRERLFRRFEQSDSAAGRLGGAGLGLAIARELVELMGGRIGVDTERGHGSLFSVEVPLELVDSPDMPAPAEQAGRAGSLRILVVEDDPTIARVLVDLLGALGHRASHVGNGLAALAELSRVEVDLALIDLDLPGIDGLQLARLLREREGDSGKRLPLLALSASAHGDEEDLVRAAGMDGFLRKPIAAHTLAAALSSWTPM